MIDIHSHILPGVDDGAENEQESIDMAKAAIEDGITAIVATPHHKNRTYDNYKEDIVKHVAVLNDLFQSKNIPLTVLPGQEVRIYGEVIEDYEKGEIQLVNDSQYLLVEFPSDSVPHYTEQLFYDLQLAGIKPVIVHPERNRELLENHDKMYQLVRKGALSQVTAASVVGKFGKKIQDFSLQLIEANLTHLIASDAHNTTTRGFHLQEAFEVVKNKYGIDMYYLLLENSNLLVENMNLNRIEPSLIRSKRKKLFGLF
ncbi:tyrosine-protein phosphatase [Pseudogracilibacillus auburnensis]|uniref:tyrosine-protein phosphatase n=1 Tax=Pseudogracilibacillus auburnensis TaxID=1494959 RepID=UPI001A96E7C3|nr:CpsB/CapC family capsule biosynthesis tyrosine phosphatase [Pseudogracilibacillus auburnensis]MBO1003227.1 tyrosine protein phosphatase [Pseudogracilibacillus auburnensis]